MQQHPGPLCALGRFLSLEEQCTHGRQRHCDPTIQDLQGSCLRIQHIFHKTVGKTLRIHGKRFRLFGIPVHGHQEQSVLGFLAEHILATFNAAGVGKHISVGIERKEPARLQGVVAAAQLAQFFRKRLQVFVLVAPGVGVAVFRILAARKACLVPIIDTGSPRHGELPGEQQLQTAFTRLSS